MDDIDPTAPALIADTGDFHINSTTALMAALVPLDDGQTVARSRRQAWIWSRFQHYLNALEEAKERSGLPLWVLIKGELADLNSHKTTQLLTRNESTVIDMAIECLAPLVKLADYLVVLRGTEAHVGASGWLDEAIARSIMKRLPEGDRLITDRANGTASHFIWRGVIGGVAIHAGHHPGTASRVPHTRGNEANRAAARIFYEYSKRNARRWKADGEPVGWPDLALFGHNHWPADSLDHHPVRCIITPSWQLNTAFGHRLGGDQLPIGANIIYCRGPHKYQVVNFHYQEPIEDFNLGRGAREIIA